MENKIEIGEYVKLDMELHNAITNECKKLGWNK